MYKFEYIYKNILKLPYTHKTLEKLAAEYSEKNQLNIKDIPLVDGVEDFLASNTLPKFVASSSTKSEVEMALEHNSISKYFKKVYTYPLSKTEAIQDIKLRLGLNSEEIVFFGDAIADYEAAIKVGVQFIARSDNSTLFPTSVRRISTFRKLTL
jgi:HAD superfamily hydrolase (TIGR01549 family)